jgi:putative molybdopterin biosynthesis protein
MIHLSLEYKFTNEPANKRLENSLLELLQAVHVRGSIAGAAEHLGRSYRYVWGQLKYWEGMLNTKLVLWGRQSQGAELTSQAVEFLHAMRESEKELEKSVLEIKRKLLKNMALLSQRNENQ